MVNKHQPESQRAGAGRLLAGGKPIQHTEHPHNAPRKLLPEQGDRERAKAGSAPPKSALGTVRLSLSSSGGETKPMQRAT